MYEGYYKVVGNPFANFIKNCIEYVIGIVIIIALLYLILKGISYIISFFTLSVGDFVEEYKDDKINAYHQNKKTKRYNRENNFEVEELKEKMKTKKLKEKKEKVYKKAPVPKEYEGMTPEEIFEDMNKKF